jgi:hypothetical protein
MSTVPDCTLSANSSRSSPESSATTSRMTDTRLQRSIRDLLWEWDPLNDRDPTDPHLPADEYDWLLPQVRRQLDCGAGVDALASFLADAVRDKYGLRRPSPTAIAERLVALPLG